MSIAFVPGSFDPMHLGHLDVVDQALEVFGAVVVGVLHNPSKPSGLFTPDERVALAEQTVGDRQNVTVGAFSGLAVQAAAAAGADIIVKGLRTTNDFDIEQQMAHNNVALTGIEPSSFRVGQISPTSAADSSAKFPLKEYRSITWWCRRCLLLSQPNTERSIHESG